ncbi:MAG: helix-hairpin-helix domain-containing protein [Bacteroidia bacterium]|nr:helix-hairpin-helix domain-containing protein [Bacteroidia bacterium]
MLKNIAIISLLALAFIFSACGEKSATKETEAEKTEMESPQAEETMEAAAVLNPNQASEEDLGALGLTEEMVAAVMEARPIMSQGDLNTLLAGMGEEALKELAAKLFIPMNLNTATEAEFKMVPGVGDKMAHEFEEYRPYTKVEQFRREMGKYVDDEEIARYEQYVFVPIDLNTATEAEIKAIPGVGNKMAHEFEEYRPYKNIEQFRREIGKYVDEKEVARLERYVQLILEEK